MNTENMNLTKCVSRFVKEQGIYEEFIKELKSKTIIHGGVIDDLYANITCDIKFIFQRGVLYQLIMEIFPNYKDEYNFKIKWYDFIEKYNVEITPSNRYFNIATPLIKNFLIENNVLNEVTYMLYRQRKIKRKEIQDNDLDKILRNNLVTIPNFFQNVLTFGSWDSLKKYEPKHITWKILNRKFDYQLNGNINLQIIP